MHVSDGPNAQRSNLGSSLLVQVQGAGSIGSYFDRFASSLEDRPSSLIPRT